MAHKDRRAPVMGQITELEQRECKDLVDGLKFAKDMEPLGAIEYPTHIFLKTKDGKLWIINRVRNCLVTFQEGH